MAALFLLYCILNTPVFGSWTCDVYSILEFIYEFRTASFLPFPWNKQFLGAYRLTLFPFIQLEDCVDINYSEYEGDNQNEKKN